ncbi:MAG: TonB family protein [Acidobacteriota bacterium]|nr:TonB family protein [Acidobacteriota bacterium]
MISNDGSAAESGSRSSYEAAVLDFLSREMDAAQRAQGSRNQSDELDALVSDLLQQVITESDGPQTVRKMAPASVKVSPPKDASPEKGASAPGIQEMNAAPQTDLDPFEDREQMFAEFMPHLDEAPASKADAAAPESRSQFNPFEDREDLIAEYMRLQEARASENENPESDSILDASNFGDMDDVLAEYMPLEQSSPASDSLPALMDETPESGQRGEENTVDSAGEPPMEESPEVEAARTEADPAQALSPTADESIPGADLPDLEEAKPSQEQAAPDRAAGVDASAASRPVPEIPKSSPTRAKPVFAAPVARRSKTPLIAAACFCVLAALAVPIYFNSGNERKPAEPQSDGAAPQLGPNGEIPAVPISQISPRYPEAALRNRESASVTLELSIDSEGNVVNATAVSGPALFHEEAIRAAKKWRYRPASRAGASIASKSRVSLNFNLKK